MLSEKDLAIIRQLSETPGLSGREKPAADLISSFLRLSNWEVNRDRLNNITASRSGTGPHLMFIAHMDEVGMMVRRITDDGFVLVHRVGGLNPVSVSGREFDLWTRKGRIPAFAGVLPPHFAGSQPSVDMDHVYFDVCADSRETAAEMGIRVGDGITSKPYFSVCGNRICGKALDDRLGCFILLKLIELIDEVRDIPNPVTMAFLGCEETMTLEAGPVMRRCRPDVVIGIDGTLPFDTPDIVQKQCDISLGKGFCIKWMDAIRGKAAYYPDHDLTDRITDFAERNGIPFQPEVIVGICNALSPVAFMNEGISTINFSIPIRYHHSDHETADLRDVESLIDIILAALKNNLFV